MPRKPRDSEYQSYTYIKNDLREKGWNVRNPSRDVNGQLYTQHECHDHPQVKEMLGKLTPEYVIVLREDSLWVIEAKGMIDDLKTAYDEAIEYGERINKHRFIRATIVSGVAGNDIDRYVVRSGFWDESRQQYVPITHNEKEITGLLSPDMASRLLEQNSPDLRDLEIDETYLVKIAEQINEIFHSSSIKKDHRAAIVATMLLSVIGETEPNYNASPTVFVKDINTRAQEVLRDQGKGTFFRYIKVRLPEKPQAQKKFKEALVTAFFLLKKVDIRSAMKMGADILGKFYETFLKYGNGAKDLGILLTPRHITKFAAEILNITYKDIVYDPCCGTGGFLVSAFYEVKNRSTPEQLDIFKQYRIFGLDQQSTVATLAIVNMLFRGDGKNNIDNDDCLANSLVSATVDGQSSAEFVSEVTHPTPRPVTKVLMNPPFALKDEPEKEYRFVEHALEQMEHGGILFSIFPSSGLVKARAYLKWRKGLLASNTLVSVISLPKDLFYPSGLPTVAIIARKGIPHPKNQNVLWMRIRNDGYRKSKGKRLLDPDTPNDLETVEDLVATFIYNPNMKVENIKEFQKAAPIDFDDTGLELVPEVYLDEKEPSREETKAGLDTIIRSMCSFMISARREQDFAREVFSHSFRQEVVRKQRYQFVEIPITDIFDPIKLGDFHVSRILDEGDIPLISCKAENNGMEGAFDIPQEKTYKNAITIACDGQPLASFYHYYSFSAKDNVLVCFPKEELRFTTVVFILHQLNRLRWRFSYGRKCYSSKIDKIRIYIPLTRQGRFDEDYMESLVKECPSWRILCRLLSEQHNQTRGD